MSLINSFEKYCFKVFRFNTVLSVLDDRRQEPDIDIREIFLGYFYGASLRLKATSTIEQEIKCGVLRKRIKEDISDDTFGYGLANLTPPSVQKGWELMARMAKRNGMLRENPFHDYMVGVLDGIETYKSYKRRCPNCLTREVQTSKGPKTQYYHRAVVLILAGYAFSIPIGLEMMRKGEDEVSCGLRLLKRVVGNLGRRFLDIVIGDALYCTPRFFKECEALGLCPGAVLKDNQENLLQTAQANTRINSPISISGRQSSGDKDGKEKEEKLELWSLDEIYWDSAEKDVRVIWAERKVWEFDEESNKDVWVAKRRVFAFSKKIDHLPAEILYEIGIHRWDIDAKIFLDVTKHWHLKHKSLHFENAYENMLSLRFLAYFTFMFFYHRNINSRRKKKIDTYIELARMLYRSACEDLIPKYTSSAAIGKAKR